MSLLYGDEFCIGLRVLGQSLRETSTGADLVALVAGEVSQGTLNVIQDDGWIVRRSNIVSNPTRWHPGKFSGVYTKLLVFGEEEYQQIVFLDADTIAVKNIDSLFLCDGFCAVLRHSERFNTGVMAIKTNAAWMDDMLARIQDVPSYTGGDQGFLNEYLNTFTCAPMFYPEKGAYLSEYESNQNLCNASYKHQVEHMGRLPTTYNADLGLFVMNSNRWALYEKDPKVIHYTLGPVKPWQWWSLWVLGNDAMAPWLHYRNMLPVSGSCLVGTPSYWRGIFSHQNSQSLVAICLWAIVLATGYRHLNTIREKPSSHVAIILPNKKPPMTLGMSSKSSKISSGFFATCVGYCSIGLSLLVALMLTPTQVCPWTGFVITATLTSLTLPLVHQMFLYYISKNRKQMHKCARSCMVYGMLSLLLFYPPVLSLTCFNTIWTSLGAFAILELVSLLTCGFLFSHMHASSHGCYL